VSNSLKYAFPGNQTGEIRISLQSDQPDHYILMVADNGTSFPTGLDFRRTKSLGLQLVCNLTKQLQGTIDLTFAPGATFKITFSEQKLKV
jgi:two-component sensor histidine kinase